MIRSSSRTRSSTRSPTSARASGSWPATTTISPSRSGPWGSDSTSSCAAATRPPSKGGTLMADVAGLTPTQTVGPFLHLALAWPDGCDVVPEGTRGAVIVTGVVLDGAGEAVGDALVETWQADPAGRFDHPDDPRGPVEATTPGFR